MLEFLRKKRHAQDSAEKVIVLGIDGVPFSLVKRFMHDGILPNFSRLVEKGTFSPMTSSIPEVSSTSWSTFMTGVNPGRHGIFGFTDVNRETYHWKFPNFHDLKSETIWDIAGRHGKRSVILNIPSTYPAKSLRGVLTSGFVSLDLKEATYPESAYEYLKSIQYRMDVNARKARESLDAFAQDVEETFETRKKAVLHFMENEEWDLFISVITETDRLNHYLWSALHDSNHKQNRFFLDFYRNIDSFIGDLHARGGDNTPFLILSDHGFTTIKREVYLNQWLREKGYLKFKTEEPKSFEDIHDESRVFALDPARFYIHLRNKYNLGSVSLSEYEVLRQELKEELLLLEIDGEKVIKKVLYKEEIYRGNQDVIAPDLVALPHNGYDLKGSLMKTSLTGRGLLTGGHTYEDAVFYMNRNTGAGDINIMDAGPTILALLGIKEDIFDGRCLIDR